MDKEPTQKQIKGILKEHFSKQKIKSIVRMTKGYSHYMYDCDLGDKYVVLRISFNKKDESCIGKEVWVIKQYKKVGVPVPKIYAYETRDKFDYAIIEKFEAEDLEDIWNKLSEKEKIEISKQMGLLLKKMHSIKFDNFGNIGDKGVIVKEDFAFRKQSNIKVKKSEWVAKLFDDGLKCLGLLIAQDLITPNQSAAIVKYLHSFVPIIRECKPVLVHTDFQLGHLFVKRINNRWHIVGLIDFEFANAYAPEFDFIKLHRAGILDDEKIKKAVMNGYSAKKVHKHFDQVVLLYRIIRDIGFASYVAKAGNLEVANKAIKFILKTVKSN